MTRRLAPTSPPWAAPGDDPQPRRRLGAFEVSIMIGISLLVLFASHAGYWPVGVLEAWAFATGGVCVWLVVKQHVWNWPLGLANNVLFFGLFFDGRLYADMGLQVAYFGLGVYGWLNWLRGGVRHGPLPVTRTTRVEWLLIGALVPTATLLLRALLVAVNGAAPFWDSLTTVLCLVAQYLLARKRLENWYFWVLADLVYVPLYASRGLPLTAVLYAVFLVMCLVGWRAWRREEATSEGVA